MPQETPFDYDSFLQSVKARKADEAKQLEKHPRWAVLFKSGKPTLALSIYGHNTKVEAVNKFIETYSSHAKDSYRDINTELERLDNIKKALADLNALKSEAEKETKKGKQ
jgi:phosphoglycolate phosphatase-like HAD superfamily hydrolase